MDRACDRRLSLRRIGIAARHRDGPYDGADDRRPQRKLDGLSYRHRRTLRRTGAAWHQGVAGGAHAEEPSRSGLVFPDNWNTCYSFLSWTSRVDAIERQINALPWIRKGAGTKGVDLQETLSIIAEAG